MKAEDLAKELIARGLVEEKTVMNLLISDDLKRCATLLHSTVCRDEHGNNCHWYEEEELDGTWTLNTHSIWIAKCQELMELLHVYPDELLKLVIEALDIVKHTSRGCLYILLKIMEADELLAMPDDQLSLLDASQQQDGGSDTSVAEA